MEHAWDGYVTWAWGADELQPLSLSGVRHGQLGGLGASIIDAMSTLWLMGMREEFQRYVGPSLHDLPKLGWLVFMLES